MAKAFALSRPKRALESQLQRQVAAMLRAYLPGEVWFTASLSGVALSPAVAGQAKAAGMERGAPDLSFIFPDGLTRYIELKTADGVLSEEQARLARTLGRDAFRVCRSWPQVQSVLEEWMTPLGLRFLTDTESVRRRGTS